MTEKQKEVIKAMQGMTYLEWVKLSHVINVRFNTDALALKNKLAVVNPEVAETEYERLF